uniref:Integrase zinc-binding domain-containing protein n=1 Tax=Ananas comosus var. bracteatus TaxID=296719 RepID=A0A6V7NP99_ANACO|nr:unnamed protein product [Ananas comosus var. bracteatus]
MRPCSGRPNAASTITTFFSPPTPPPSSSSLLESKAELISSPAPLNDATLGPQAVRGVEGRYLTEAHRSSYMAHPGRTKMYRDLKENFWWQGMKFDMARHVA